MKTRLFNKLTFTFVIFILFSSISVFGQLTDLIAKNEKAIFVIYTYDEYGIASGMGTGFFIDAKGTGITNFHVLDGASKAVIKLSDNTKFDISKIIASNKDADLIKFSVNNPTNKNFNFLTLAQSQPQKGQKIFVIGNPEGLESSVSEGIVSSMRELNDFGNVIQITAPISPGSSGSPIMTMDGSVVAVVSFQLKEGQNLNFGIDIKKLKELSTLNAPKSLYNILSNLIVVNSKCQGNSELVLNSIEFLSDRTIANFSFTNVSMAYGDNMIIWTARGQQDNGFFVQDLDTKNKYYLLSATIGTSRDDATKVKLGETKRFSVTFEKVPNDVKRINILEGYSSSWNFMNLKLDDYRYASGKDVTTYQKNLALNKLSTSDFSSAKDLLSETIKSNKNDDDAYNILGIISYVMDNNFDAITFFSKAIDINPQNDIYYLNRFTVYEYQKRYDDALMDISLAIRTRPAQGDYYYKRALLYAEMKNYEKAIADISIAINQMGENATIYDLRGNYKTWIKDLSGACEDWKKAYQLTNYSRDDIKQKISKYCR